METLLLTKHLERRLNQAAYALEREKARTEKLEEQVKEAEKDIYSLQEICKELHQRIELIRNKGV